MKVKHKTILQNQKMIAAGEISLSDIVESCLEKIELGSELNACIDVFATEARDRARNIQKKCDAGRQGKLAGTILAVKDNIAMQNIRLSAGSKMLADYISPFSATVIQRLEAEDAIIIARTNMDEFAMGSSNENSYFGKVKNPHNHAYVPGGSSGGSAAAVAAEMCTAALGTDTGGSVRQPAAFCGVLGMKPTYGRISRYGLAAFASSLDQAGIMTNNVTDLALMLEVASGQDEADGTSARVDVPEFSSEMGDEIGGMKIGIPKQYISSDTQQDILTALEATKSKIRRAGAEIVEVDLSLTDYAIATYYIICTAEASSNLSRYDGVRYSYRASDVTDLEDMYTRSRSEGFGDEVKRRIMLGTYVLSSGYYDAFYRRAQKVRTLIRQDFNRAFEKCDVLLSPTTPATAFRFGEKTDPVQMYLNDIYTISANLTGMPALSFPAGKDAAGLPVGLQLTGKPFDESSLLKIAFYLEENDAI